MTDRERPLEPSPAETGPAQLSRLLWQARESLEMWADAVEAKSRRPDDYTRGIVAEIDAYRAQHGWSRSGYGGEWLCPWCGDHFGPRDDDSPPVCVLCRRAGRGVPAQDAVESVSGSGGNADGRLESGVHVEFVSLDEALDELLEMPGMRVAVEAGKRANAELESVKKENDMATEHAECPDPDCLSDGPHLVSDDGSELECGLCHVPFPNPFFETDYPDKYARRLAAGEAP